MSDPTLRQRLEAIRDAARIDLLAGNATNAALTRQFRDYAIAALDALNNARAVNKTGAGKLLKMVYDPEPSDD